MTGHGPHWRRDPIDERRLDLEAKSLSRVLGIGIRRAELRELGLTLTTNQEGNTP